MASIDTIFTKADGDFPREKDYPHDEVLGKGGFRKVLPSRLPKQDTS